MLQKALSLAISGLTDIMEFGPCIDYNRNCAIFDNTTNIPGHNSLKFEFMLNIHQ